jgi:glycosyltransferase involved in cell wall biosynthesis
MIVPENVLTIPIHIPLGLALTEVIAETNLPTTAHHHDFYWELDRFMNNCVSDYLRMAFPPNLPSVEHVVINSFADEQLSLRTGISSTMIPNIMDFEHPPLPPDTYASDVRQSLGIEKDELFVLQPTRVVARKGIEHAIELVHRLGRQARLVVSHASGDEGYDYEQRLKEYSQIMGVQTVFVSDIINEQRGLTGDGKKIYTLDDVYPHADLVTYPSTIEGFGNAFLEAVYFRKPIVVNRYSIYSKDIRPKGFRAIELEGYVTQAAIRQTQTVLDDPVYCKEMVDHNYRVACDYFSFSALQQNLHHFVK